MASRDTEGRREVQAARKRLAAAKSQSSSAAKALKSATGTEDSSTKIAEEARKMAEMAKKNREVATSQYEDSKKEVAEAEAFLKEAEKRCEVVDVDSNDDKGLFDVDTDNGSNENEGRKKKKQKTGAVEAIVVEGCGMPGVNGTYKRSDKMRCGVHTYHKEGQWKGKDATYRIFYESCLKMWCIGVGAGCWLYSAPATTDALAKVPPENGWKVMRKGANPAPKLKWS